MRKIDSLEELKQIELNIMKKIHKFCENEGIKYCLGYGTLLGAVRHNGFIPWDDDIDIMMDRENYEIFKKKFGSFAKKNDLSIVTYDSEKHYPRDMIKVCDSRTIFREDNFLFQDDLGCFVDIWPIDGTAKNPLHRCIHNIKSQYVKALLYAGVIEKPSGGFIKKKIKCYLAKKARNKGIDNIVKKSMKLSQKYKYGNSKIVECYSAPGRLSHFRRKSFDNICLHQFEEFYFYIPVDYDGILKKQYGDYMKLPPKEAQVSHHLGEYYWID